MDISYLYFTIIISQNHETYKHQTSIHEKQKPLTQAGGFTILERSNEGDIYFALKQDSLV